MIRTLRVAAYALLVTATISLAWVERRIYVLFQQLEKGRAAVSDRPDSEMVPTWRETAKVVVLFLVLVIALAFLLTVGSD